MNKNIHPDEIRQKYLDFFKSKNHLVYPSASLKSEDPGLMFNVAGMQQFKPYFQGATPKFPGVEGVWPRVVSSQKCMRAGGKDSDIENVGRTRRHHTFFEMLGNFSFGDYFKKEAAEYAWEFLTSPEWLGLDPELLSITVFNDDDEAYDIWLNHVGIPADKLSRFGEDENFWPANAVKDGRSGPCGPCSEIFYDRGEEFGSEDETGPNTGDGDRFVEIWNLVFTQFNLEDGVLSPLPQKNIDTGSGLERVVAAVTGAKDAYATELFQPTIRKLVKITDQEYQDAKSVEFRIIADHMRSISFAISDGIMPANDGAGYVIKMLIRRASRQAYLLGIKEPVLYDLVDEVIEAMGNAYPSLKDASERIKSIIKNEEEQFLRTLGAGIERVNKIFSELDGKVLDGAVAFDLWQTYGFPLDLTQDMADVHGIVIDKAGYEKARAKAREISKADAGEVTMFTGENDILADIAIEHGETEFLGYKQSQTEAKVLAIVKDNKLVKQANEADNIEIILDKTPFYAEGGGQIADVGVLEQNQNKIIITNTQKNSQGLFIHKGKVLRGQIKLNDIVTAKVDPIRQETKKHHSATHLLHKALRQVLGTHVAQAGSLVAPDRLRFDFSHPQAVIPAELKEIELLVNKDIQANQAVDWKIVAIEEARKAGAMMLFGEKYGENVRMVKMADSIELCGGLHVEHTGDIGSFIIVSEDSVSAGVRRLEAITGFTALEYIRDLQDGSNQLARKLGVKPEELSERISKLQDDLKQSQREIGKLRDKLASAQTSGTATTELKEAAGYKYLTSILNDLDANTLRNTADSLLEKSGADIVVLASGKLLVTKVSKAAQAKGAHAGNIIREVAKIAGGGGGGRPDMAQAGVKDPSKLQTALDAITEILNQ